MESFLKDLFRKKNTFALKPGLNWFQEEVDSEWEDHLFIQSSGTSQTSQKVYALSYNALKESAKSVQEIIPQVDFPKWLSPLPPHHIGGLSTFSRAVQYKGSSIFLKKWNLQSFLNQIKNEGIHFTSIVPTIAYDIAKHKILSPPSLLAVFVGGDRLNERLKKELLNLNWPLYITYGMTECSSQLATSKANYEETQFLDILSNHEVKAVERKLFIKSKSLYSCLYKIKDNTIEAIETPKLDKEGIWQTNDLIETNHSNAIYPLGRSDDFIKVKGHFFSLGKLTKDLEKKFSIISGIDFYFSVQADLRDGFKATLYKSQNLSISLSSYIKENSPFKYFELRSMDDLEKTDLGKIKRK